MPGQPLGDGGRALVTGGTSGIGAAFARDLAARGHDLLLVARDESRLTSYAGELAGRYGVDVATLSADLALDADLRRVADRLTDADDPIEVLVDNAGFGVHHRLTDPDTGPHEHALDVMVKGYLVLGGAAGRAMAHRGHGAIVITSSTAGQTTMGSYAAIKAWTTAYGEALATELDGSGVSVTTLLPGWVRTEFHDRAAIRTGSIPAPLWQDPERLVQSCLDDVNKGVVVSVPQLRWKVLSTVLRHLPRSAVRKVSRSLSSSRATSAPGDGSEPRHDSEQGV